MLYKPNYCCNCGEKIERREWNLLTSRRFCEVCSAENKMQDRLPQLVAAVGVLGVVFGIGSFFGGSSTATPARTFREPVSTQPERKVEELDETARRNSLPQTPVASNAGAAIAPGRQGEQFALQKEQPVAPIYFCGAMTKKGTPCSRKVKKQGAKCWQHAGVSQNLPEN